MDDAHGIHGEMAALYDVFVDWEGRLGRELPGLLARLREIGAKRVLDVGCGTGRHVAALLEEGFDAFGADVSEAMLAQGRALVGEPQRFFRWQLGEAPPNDLPAPFDALICLGNVWPQLTDEAQIARAAASLHDLLRPGGLALLGLKALALRRESQNPYLPLLRREHEGEPIFFLRFVDFFEPGPWAEFHMVVLQGEACRLHNRRRVRIWSPDELAETFRRAGMRDVRVSARLDDPDLAPSSEDVFVHARRE